MKNKKSPSSKPGSVSLSCILTDQLKIT